MQQDSIGFLLADVSRMLRRAFQQQLEGSPLTLAQARALVYVSRHQGIRQVDLASMLEIKPITLARLIDQLAAAGLIERCADPGDRRAHKIFLTSDAATHLTAIDDVASSIRADAMRGLDEQQITLVFAALHKMRDNLSSF